TLTFMMAGWLLLAGSVYGQVEDAATKSIQYTFRDGVTIQVHFLEEKNAFARDVLDAAVNAYQTITDFYGFRTPGYAIADPNKDYAYDPDKTVDIYLGPQKGASAAGFTAESFKDAPCFDTVNAGSHAYQAAILLPANYHEFIKSWDAMNPSVLGDRNWKVDLRGTLIHEMLHVILFYYNKNLDKDGEGSSNASKKVDWYVEGLARYFETFAGARHDFYSQGFKQTLPDKIRFSRGGSNFFMRYPDQAFTDLRYENALFWRFIDCRYGMAVIEKLGRDFRLAENQDFKKALEAATGVSFNELLGEYALAILLKDFGLKEETVYLKEVAQTRLLYQEGNFFIKDGHGGESFLGKTCAVDWIGQWDKAAAHYGEPHVAGDNTLAADVSGWATDFYEIEIGAIEPGFKLGVLHLAGSSELQVQMIGVTRGGARLVKKLSAIASAQSCYLAVESFLREKGLAPQDLEKIYILITNTDPRTTSTYELFV
ncbi:MAG: hypothetical protein HY592_00850, partial [Candidatus Omnitrophica bacterium]|nr:hypothetical protein [Candidatus Omnitrophota bacterium]